MYLSGQGKVGRGRGGGKKLTGRRKDKRKLAGTLEARHRGLPPLGKGQVQVRKRLEHALSRVANAGFEKCVTQHA